MSYIFLTRSDELIVSLEAGSPKHVHYSMHPKVPRLRHEHKGYKDYLEPRKVHRKAPLQYYMFTTEENYEYWSRDADACDCPDENEGNDDLRLAYVGSYLGRHEEDGEETIHRYSLNFYATEKKIRSTDRSKLYCYEAVGDAGLEVVVEDRTNYHTKWVDKYLRMRVHMGSVKHSDSEDGFTVGRVLCKRKTIHPDGSTKAWLYIMKEKVHSMKIGTEFWVPDSQVHPDCEVTEVGEEGELMVTHWFAKREGWEDE